MISHSKFNELYRQSGMTMTQKEREKAYNFTNYLFSILEKLVDNSGESVDKNELLFVFQDLDHTLDLSDVNLTVIDHE